MTPHAALLDDCIAAPDDDAPRLVWADAVGGERGEFVVVQCALARGDLPPADAGRLRRRQRELLGQHGAEWSQLAGLATRVMFRRGFVEAAELDAGRFEEALERAPLLRSLNATGLRTAQQEERVAMAKLERMFRSPAIGRLRGLFLDQAFHTVETDTGRYLYETETEYTYYADPAIRLADALGVRLRAFGMKWSHGMVALRETAFLQRAERIVLDEECPVDDLLAILHRDVTPRLIALDLGTRVYPLDQLIPKLPTRLRELHVRQYQGPSVDAHVTALARRCPRLEKLSIRGATFDDPAVLLELAKLRALCVADCVFATRHARKLAAFLKRPMPALRELAVFASLDDGDIDRVLAALGGQLEYLDLAGSRAGGAAARLERTFAGIVAARVRSTGLADPAPLLHESRELGTTLTL